MIAKINSRKITLLALLLWSVSIFLPAIATYTKSMYGYEVLSTGWLGPLVGNFAWYANILFWFAVIQLLNNKSIPLHSSFFAVIISATMFTFGDLTISASGATTPIYGYGMGSILWMTSILLVFFATTLQIEAQKKDSVLKYVSLVLIIVLTISSLWFAIFQRMKANSQEEERLSRVVFKRGPVCSANAPIARVKLQLNGPLELISDSNEYLEKLLAWGIPVVRFANQDYYIGIIAEKPRVTSRLAHGPSGAILESSSYRVSDHKSFDGFNSLKMYSSDRKVIIFEQVWKREHSNIYCPDFYSVPDEDQQPRKLILSAFKNLGH